MIVPLLAWAACVGAPPPRPPAPGAPASAAAMPPRLQICLRAGVGIYGYTYDQLIEGTRQLENTPCLAVLSERDIQTYRAGATPSGRIEIVLTPEASRSLASKGNRTYDVCREGPFTVTLDARPLYSGQCYLQMGAAALRYPVMHVDASSGDGIVLRIGDHQGAWAGLGSGDPEAARRIDPPELRALFANAGKLEMLK